MDGNSILNSIAPSYGQTIGYGTGAMQSLWDEAFDPNAVTAARQSALSNVNAANTANLDRTYRSLLRRGGDVGGLNDASLQRMSMRNAMNQAQALTAAEDAAKNRQLSLQNQLAQMGQAAQGQALTAGTSLYGADKNYDASIYGTDKSAEASMYGSDQSRIASMYGSDMGYQSTLADAAARRDVANTQAQAQMYGYDKSYDANIYNTDAGLAQALMGLEQQQYQFENTPQYANSSSTYTYIPGRGYIENPGYVDSSVEGPGFWDQVGAAGAAGLGNQIVAGVGKGLINKGLNWGIDQLGGLWDTGGDMVMGMTDGAVDTGVDLIGGGDYWFF